MWSYMSPLSFILIIASIVFLIFAIDGLQRRKLNFIHFLIFVGGAGIILISLFYPGFQEKFAAIFGVARIADIIVYGALIVLGYFYFELLNTITKDRFNTTRLVGALGIQHRTGNEKPHSHNEKSHFCFLIRAYNEEQTLGAVIDTVIGAGYSKIVIVNDGSMDGTAHIVRKKQEQHTHAMILLISHPINRGGGAANKTGFSFIKQYGKELGVEWLVTYDADGQMDIDDMKTFQHMIHSHPHAKAFLGSRFIEGGEAENMPLSRKIILLGSKVVTLIFNRLNVSDPHNGYRALHLDTVQKIVLSSDGMTYASELLDSIRRHRIAYKEVPVHINYTEYSLGKGQKNGNAIKILVEMIYKKVFFK